MSFQKSIHFVLFNPAIEVPVQSKAREVICPLHYFMKNRAVWKFELQNSFNFIGWLKVTIESASMSLKYHQNVKNIKFVQLDPSKNHIRRVAYSIEIILEPPIEILLKM